MKTVKLIFGLVILTSFTFTSCKKESPDPAPTTPQTTSPTPYTFRIIPIHTGAFLETRIYNESNVLVTTKNTSTPVGMECDDPIVNLSVPLVNAYVFTVKGLKIDSTEHTLGIITVNGNTGYSSVTDYGSPPYNNPPYTPDVYALQGMGCTSHPGVIVISY